MDHLGLFHRKLRFIWWFYNESVERFVEIKRKIEAQQEPYVWRGDPENFDGEPPFLEEWQDADMAANLVGQSCLGVLVQSLHEYVHEHTEMLISRYGTNDRLTPKKTNKGWFNDYCALYAEHGLDWGVSPADLGFLEHIILTRNDSQHFMNDWDVSRRQTEQHSKKHPEGVLVHEFDRAANAEGAEAGLGPDPGRIAVNRDNLRLAMDEVERFARFVEGGCKPGFAPTYPRWERAWPPEEPETKAD